MELARLTAESDRIKQRHAQMFISGLRKAQNRPRPV
jgi:hypothetical protein